PARHHPCARSARPGRCPFLSIADRLTLETRPVSLTSWFRASRPCRDARRPAAKKHTARRCALRLEFLEDRSVPSTLTVVNDADSGAGSLWAAITAAHNGDTIAFTPSLIGDTITLTSGELVVNKSLDILGPGAAKLTVSGNDAGRVFNVVNPNAKVTIAG